ncbi:MAG: MerR family transcriptional regulator [Armatimonadetes bacterium]|nr:MerR family transcriptional regulator [Armatimonadota bacterium]
MSRSDEERCYGIRIAAALVASHPQTLRMYERTGLLQPRRSGGNARIYTEHDLQRIRRIQSYTAMGVNLAGVEIIFRLLEQIDELEARLAQAAEGLRQELEAELTERLRAQLRDEENRR